MSAHNFIDLTNQRFGRLTVIERVENAENRQARWLARCSCGNEVIVRGAELRKANGTRSCGCLNKEIVGNLNRSHGMYGTKIYKTWAKIKSRCLNPADKRYKDYGGRGITICDEWKNDFRAFFDFVSKLEHYGDENYTLDRIDVNGDYEPGNVRWADWKTQARNKRNNIIVEYQGELTTLTEASEKSGINHGTLCYRYHRGDRGDYLFRPVEKR